MKSSHQPKNKGHLLGKGLSLSSVAVILPMVVMIVSMSRNSHLLVRPESLMKAKTNLTQSKTTSLLSSSSRSMNRLSSLSDSLWTTCVSTTCSYIQSSKQIGSSSSTRTATNQKSHDLFANTSVPQISDLDVDPTAPTDESKETADCTPSPIDVTDEWPSVEVSMSIPITSLDDDMIVVESVNAGAGTQESQISRVKELIQFWNLQQSTNF